MTVGYGERKEQTFVCERKFTLKSVMICKFIWFFEWHMSSSNLH